MKQPTPIMSKDVFNDICDLLCIPEDEREKIVTLDVHLDTDGLVTYTSENIAIRDD